MDSLSRAEPCHDAIKSLLSQFNLWTAVNGVFAESDASLDSRLAAESDDLNIRVIVCNLRYMCSVIEKSATWSSAQPLEEIRAVLKSLHSLGASLAAAYPSNRLVYKVAAVFKEPEPKRGSRLPNLFDCDDVVVEMKQWHLGYDTGRMTVIAASICKEYQVVFAILLLLYRPMKIFDFIDAKLNDTKLPFKTGSKSNDGSKNLFQAIELTAEEKNQFIHYQQIIWSRYPEYFMRNTQPRLQVPEDMEMRTSPFSIQTERNELDDAESSPRIKQPFLQLPSSRSPPLSPSSTDHQQSVPKRGTVLDEISYLDLNISAGVPVTGNLTHYRCTPQKHEQFLLGNPRPRTLPRLPAGYTWSGEDKSYFSQEKSLQVGRWGSPTVESMV